MINHITLFVNDFKKSRDFFATALKPLGYMLLSNRPESSSAGFGTEDTEGKRDFWIAVEGKKKEPHSFSCLAFTASSKKMVESFYEAALEAGGKDNGPPGYRKKYHPGYYAAYVLDPDGHNIEAVFDDPSPTE